MDWKLPWLLIGGLLWWSAEGKAAGLQVTPLLAGLEHPWSLAFLPQADYRAPRPIALLDARTHAIGPH
jgi:hypothetical protein